jgi:uncharacterized coiled-coil DUF342 family protein
MSDHPTKSSRTSQKLRQTNENIIISEIRSLNTRVAELLEQFGLLTMEIGNVADDLERLHTGTDTVHDDLVVIKEQFSELNKALEDTQKKVGILERKLADLEKRNLNMSTYHQSGEESGTDED